MAGKKAEDLFIKDGEFHEPALRGAFEKWVNRDWTYGPGIEKTIIARDANKMEAVCFKQFDNWINRQVEDDWFKDVKEEYGMRVPREIFYDYWENNEEFRNNVRSHVEGTDEYYERQGKNPEVARQDDDSEEEEGDDKDQSSFGASQFPQLFDLGVVGESAGLKTSKLRGLAVAFVGDIEEIRGETREFDVKWVQHAFLYWGSDKWGDEWIKFVAKYTAGGDIYDAIEWAYENHDEASALMEKKYNGGFDLEVGNPDTNEMSKAFLDIEVPGWDEEDEDEGTDKSKSKWEEFEEQSEQLDRETEGARDKGKSETGEAEDGESGETKSKWERFEEQSEAATTDSNEPSNTNGQGEDSDSISNDSGRASDTSSNPNDLGDWAASEGVADEKEFRNKKNRGNSSDSRSGVSKTENRSKTSSSAETNATTVECEDGGRPHEIKWPNVEPIDEFERNRIHEGNTFEWAMKLPENSVDTMVTSPPYYALRDYDIDDAFPISGDFTCDHEWQDEFCVKCGSFLGQLGHEPDPATFVEHIVDLMDRYKRVLKPSGSLWLNIGDTYAGKDIDGRVKAKNKSRMMIPERVYRRMVQTGWHLRDYVIWVKKVWMPDDDLRGNGKPFASSSRLADQWEPMVRFSPTPDPYSDVDSNRLLPPSFDGDLGSEGIEGKFRKGEDTQRGKTYNELGTNPPDVWLINSDGYDGDHRAVFPEELPKRCISITTPDKVCGDCGRPYDKEVHVEDGNVLSPGGDYATYEPRCHCDADDKPGVAFDPFLGSGTTAVAAANNGYDWAGVELSDKYAELARKRIPDGRQVGLDQW